MSCKLVEIRFQLTSTIFLILSNTRGKNNYMGTHQVRNNLSLTWDASVAKLPHHYHHLP